MKISHPYAALFEGAKVLLLVVAKQTGSIICIDNSVINKTERFEVDVESYSDREGAFKRGSGEVLQGGAPYEEDKENIQKEFTKLFLEKLKGVDKGFGADRMYLFVPAYRAVKIVEALPREVEKKIFGIYEGNFVKDTPLDLVKKIYKKDKQKKELISVDTSTEARKILRRSST